LPSLSTRGVCLFSFFQNAPVARKLIRFSRIIVRWLMMAKPRIAAVQQSNLL